MRFRAAVLDGNVANATNDGNRFFGDYATNVTISGFAAFALIADISANALKSCVGGIGGNRGNAPNATLEVCKLPVSSSSLNKLVVPILKVR
ncbi:hypothetical protein K2Z84_14360 [Candidatus Binatia bacterium]|nr:hypothetical protein [Candidatus Binatia bacterium]